MNLSVVIPAYNEEKDIKEAVFEVARAHPEAEIIVVNDASTDRTYEMLREAGMSTGIHLKIITNGGNMGHGASVMTGLQAATGDYILYIDADRQLDVDPMIPRGVDFISGSRIHRSDKLFRKVISFCLKMTNLIFHGIYIKDANCPLKIYRRAALMELLDEVPKTYIVPIACIEVLARRHGFSTATIATPHKPYDGIREGFLQVPDLKAWKFFISAFFEVVKL